MLSRKSEENKLLNQNRNLFFNPIISSKKKRILPPESKNCNYYLKQFTKVSLASCAAYLVVKPSIRYAKSNIIDTITIPPSTIITGFLINLSAIEYLWAEIKYAEGMHKLILLSFILGAISSLPSSFIQMMESDNDGTAYSIVTSILVGIGSTPLQTLGFFDFIKNIFPYLRNIYYRYCSRHQDAAQYVKEYEASISFLKKLENGIENSVMLDTIPHDYLLMPEEELFLSLLNNVNYDLSSKNSVYWLKNLFYFTSGLVGIALSESINVSFIQSTQDIFSLKLPITLSALFTSLIVLPMVVLSGEFGYNALQHCAHMLGNVVDRLKEAIRVGNLKFNFKPPYGINNIAGGIAVSLSILIASRSYSGLVQFNIDIFSKDSSVDLDTLNALTKVGGLIFNIYGIQKITENLLCKILLRFGDNGTQNKVIFHKFGQNVLRGYKSMPHGLLFSGSEKHLQITLEDSSNSSEQFNKNVIELASFNSSQNLQV